MKLISTLLFILLFSPTSDACKLLARFALYPPHAMLNEQQQWQGTDVEQVKRLFKQTNCDLAYTQVPWARATQMLKVGELDIMTGMSITTKRKKFAYFIGPQRLENIVLVSSKQAPITLAHLKQFNTRGKPIAIQKGAYYGERFQRIFASTPNPQAHFLMIPNNKIKFPLLLKGRISGFIEEQNTILHHLNTVKPQLPYEVNFEIIHSNPVYIAISKQSINKKTFKLLQQAFNSLNL